MRVCPTIKQLSWIIPINSNPCISHGSFPSANLILWHLVTVDIGIFNLFVTGDSIQLHDIFKLFHSYRWQIYCAPSIHSVSHPELQWWCWSPDQFVLEIHFTIIFHRKVADNLKNKKLHVELFRKTILQNSVIWLVCQIKWNLDNGKEINQVWLWTAKEQAVDVDIVNRKRGYDEEIKFFECMNTWISILLNTCIILSHAVWVYESQTHCTNVSSICRLLAFPSKPKFSKMRLISSLFLSFHHSVYQN
jgi:hypothetical protein